MEAERIISNWTFQETTTCAFRNTKCQGTERPVVWQPWERHIQALQLALKLPT